MKRSGRAADRRMNRQKILDYLREHPMSTCPTIASAVGATPKQTVARLTQMRKNDEVVAAEVWVDNLIVRHYEAKVKLTMSRYPPVSDKGSLPLWGKRVKAAEPKPVGNMSNRCDDSKRPIPNQGGQGTLKQQPRTGVALAA